MSGGWDVRPPLGCLDCLAVGELHLAVDSLSADLSQVVDDLPPFVGEAVLPFKQPPLLGLVRAESRIILGVVAGLLVVQPVLVGKIFLLRVPVQNPLEHRGDVHRSHVGCR